MAQRRPDKRRERRPATLQAKWPDDYLDSLLLSTRAATSRST